MKHTKSSTARFMKVLRTAHPDNSSSRNPMTFQSDRLTQREFKRVLPPILRDNISAKGSNLKPEYNCVEPMNLMINCLKSNDFNEAPCQPEVKQFVECYQSFTITTKKVMEELRSGNYNFEEDQKRYPARFLQKMFNQFKQPRKVDNGPPMPVK